MIDINKFKKLANEIIANVKKDGIEDIFVVTMHLNSLSEHSYVVGVYEDFQDAKKAGNIEELNRAGKYDADINGYTLNELPEQL